MSIRRKSLVREQRRWQKVMKDLTVEDNALAAQVQSLLQRREEITREEDLALSILAVLNTLLGPKREEVPH